VDNSPKTVEKLGKSAKKTQLDTNQKNALAVRKAKNHAINKCGAMKSVIKPINNIK